MPVPLIAWIAALALAVVVLAFCGYEVLWKTRRLRRDLARLNALGEQVQQLQRQAEAAARRISNVTG